jgi:hypothetical protein
LRIAEAELCGGSIRGRAIMGRSLVAGAKRPSSLATPKLSAAMVIARKLRSNLMPWRAGVSKPLAANHMPLDLLHGLPAHGEVSIQEDKIRAAWWLHLLSLAPGSPKGPRSELCIHLRLPRNGTKRTCQSPALIKAKHYTRTSEPATLR